MKRLITANAYPISRITASWPEPLTYDEYPEGDQIMPIFLEALNKLGVYSEPSARGGDGIDFLYDARTQELLAEIDLGEEEDRLLEMYEKSASKADFKKKVTAWLKKLCNTKKLPLMDANGVIKKKVFDALRRGASFAGYIMITPLRGKGMIRFYKDSKLVFEMDTADYGQEIIDIYNQNRDEFERVFAFEDWVQELLG